MSRNISDTSSVSGANMILVFVAVMFTGVVCVAGYSIRWVQWCNMTDTPYISALWNISCIMTSAYMTALISKDMVPARRVWEVVMFYAAFWAVIPTCMFFTDYVAALMMMSVAVYAVWQTEKQNAKAYLFFSAFVIGIAMWWVPATVCYMAVLYAGVFVFAPQDMRHWVMPLAGLGAAVLISITCVALQTGEVTFPEVYSPEGIFSMPYTEKVFKAHNMYFYVGVLALMSVVAYMKYISSASGDVRQEKKQAMMVSMLWITSIAMAVCVHEARYMAVFSSVPFAMVTARFTMDENVSKFTRMVFRWILVIVALVGMWTFK